MEESRTAVLAALLGNGSLAVLKGVTAAATGSAAMLAETFHSVADTGNQALLFLGMRLARQGPDRDHPFGHGKNVYFWAFVVSMMLFTLGGALSIREAVLKLREPGAYESSPWAYAVLGAGFVFDGFALAVAAHGVRRVKGRRSLRRFWRENRDPTLITVVLEDSAALVSLVVAAIGLGLAQMTGQSVWDALASGVIGVLLLGVATALAIENHSLLIGEAAPRGIETRIRRAVEAEAVVASVVALRTMHVGPREVLVVLHVQLRDDCGVAEGVARVRRRVESALEPEVDRSFIAIEPVPADRARRAA
jgi:cation diffusion facilitator family transporter